MTDREHADRIHSCVNALDRACYEANQAGLTVELRAYTFDNPRVEINPQFIPREEGGPSWSVVRVGLTRTLIGLP